MFSWYLFLHYASQKKFSLKSNQNRKSDFNKRQKFQELRPHLITPRQIFTSPHKETKFS